MSLMPIGHEFRMKDDADDGDPFCGQPPKTSNTFWKLPKAERKSVGQRRNHLLRQIAKRTDDFNRASNEVVQSKLDLIQLRKELASLPT